MSIKVGTGNTGVSGIYFGTNKTVQSVYLQNTLVWSANANVFTISLSPTTLSSSGGTGTVTFSFGVSDYSFGTKPSWVSNVTTTTSSGKVTGLTFSYEQNTGSQRTENLTFFANGTNRTVQLTQSATSTVSVTGVSITDSDFTLTVGSTKELHISVTPSNATDKSVVWSSSNTSVASVNSSGIVTANATGSATITVRTNDGNYTDTITATIAAATSVTTELNYAGLGGTDYIYITGSLSYWQIDTSTAPDWISYDASYGTTSPIAIRAASNETGSARIGTLRLNVNGTLYTVAINQAKIVAHLFKINPTPADATVLIDGQQRTNNQAYFAPTAEIPWEVSKTGYVTQSGTLTMGYTDYTMNVTLVAATYTLSVNPASREFDYDEYGSSGGKSISITSNQSWTISVPMGFSISRSTSGSDNATFNVYPTSYNSGTTNKTGTLRITGNDSQYVDVPLTQKALIMTLDPTTLSVSASGGSYSVSVGDPNNYGWTISSNQSWCGVSPSSGTGNATVSVSIGQNSGSSNRGATITLSSNTNDIADITCAVSQSAAQAISFSPSRVDFVGTGSEEVIGINGTFSNWEITSYPTSWCTVTMVSGDSNNPIVIEASSNTGSTTRTGTLVVEVDGVEYQIPLSQVAASAVTYNFIVSASPSGCTVLINDSVRTNNTFACPAGTEVRWSVSKTGYVTQTGTYTMTASSHTQTVTLSAATLSVSYIGSPSPISFDYDDHTYADGKLITVNSNQSWSATITGDFRFYGNVTTWNDSGNGSVTIYPSSTNSGSSNKTGTISISGTYGGSASVSLAQTPLVFEITGEPNPPIGETSGYIVDPLIPVTWSVTTGSSKCSTSTSGNYFYVTPNENAQVDDTIVIRATSTEINTRYAELTLTVSEGAVIGPDSITVSGSDNIYTTTNKGTYTATIVPSGSGEVVWSVAGADASKCTIVGSGTYTTSQDGTSDITTATVTVKSSATYLCEARVVATSVDNSSVYGSMTIYFVYRS